MKANYLITVAAATIVGCGSLFADSLPLQSVNKAGEVIDAAIEAHGGAETISNLKSLVQTSDFTNIASGQSRKPEPPYDRSETLNFNAINTQDEVFVTRNTGEGGGYVFDQGTVVTGDSGWQLNYRAGTAAPMVEPDFNALAGPFVRVTPALLMKQLQSRRGTSNWLGEAEINGRMHDVITLVMETGPALGLYIDQETHMLTRMERVLPPFGQVEYEFLDYSMVDGIAFNKRFKLLVNGDDNLEFVVRSTEVNAPLEAYVAVPDDLEKVAAISPDPLSTQEIDEGVFLIGGNGTYALFVEMADHVVAVGGTQTVPTSIAEMRKVITDKPIKYGVLTHHHSDHIPGAANYAEQGATIITFKENENVVRNAAGDDDAKLEFVEDSMTLTDGNRKVVLYNIGPTPHAENMLIAYLPDQGIVFEADHFPQPGNGVIPPAVPATIAFAEALERLNLDYNKIVGAHSSRVASPADVQTALSREAATATGGR